MTAPVCFVDTETLGLDADHHPIWEVGYIGPDGREVCWQLELTPRQITLAHPKALEIGRFSDRYEPDLAVTRRDFCAQFAALTDGLHLAGAVISFDEERLRRLFWAEGVQPGWHYHIIDVESLAAGWLMGSFNACQSVGNPEADGPTAMEAGAAVPPWNSNDLSLAVDVDPEDYDRHTALGDARWAKAIYEAVMGQ